jgi:hypothetical protein
VAPYSIDLTTTDDGWGDEAVLQWEATEVTDSDDDDVSSVPPDEAGLEDDEGTWGRDAVIDFTYELTEITSVASDSEGSAGAGAAEEDILLEEHVDQLLARGMPQYDTWTIPKLQVCLCALLHRPF